MTDMTDASMYKGSNNITITSTTTITTTTITTTTTTTMPTDYFLGNSYPFVLGVSPDTSLL